MNRTWIGSHRPITIGPIVKPSAHLILPQCASLEDRRMRALVYLYIIEEVAHAHVQNAPRVLRVSTWARSRAEAVERDLLVAYPVIDIRANTHQDRYERSI